MKELVLDLVTSCENRISIIEELITGAFCTVTTMDAELVEVSEERRLLESHLQELLAKNCSLRKKDFNTLMGPAISRHEKDLKALAKDRQQANEGLRSYLDELKQSVCRLRKQLADFADEKGDTAALEATMGRIEAAYRHGGQQAFTLLRDFQVRLQSFRREMEEMNSQLQRLLGMGEALRTEDLRQLPTNASVSARGTTLDLRQVYFSERCLAGADSVVTPAVESSQEFIKGGAEWQSQPV